MVKTDQQLRIGAHTSASGGVHQALYEAKSIGANVTQLFTANQRRWDSPLIEDHQLALWKKAQDETGIYEVMSHDSYLINFAAIDEEILSKSLQAIKREIQRCRKLGVKWLNFHPGSSVDGDEARGLHTIVKSLKNLREECPDEKLMLLLEATAGQGTQLGCKLEHLAYIIREVGGCIPLGVCIDTCHVFAAGYDIRAREGWSNFLQLFDQIVGLRFLQALHLNDSVKDLGLRVDRHAALGLGKIGYETFFAIVKDPRSRGLPMFLETPLGVDVWREEIAQLRKAAQEL